MLGPQRCESTEALLGNPALVLIRMRHGVILVPVAR